MTIKQSGLRDRLDKLYSMLIEDYKLNPENESDSDMFDLLDEIDILVTAQENALKILNNKLMLNQ